MLIKSLVVIALSAMSGALGAYTAWCTNELNGTGGNNHQITKDCCAATKEHSTTAYSEVSHECQDAAGLGNGINLARFSACCQSRHAGCHT